MARPLDPDRLGSRLAEVYAVVGPVYRRAQRTVENGGPVEGVSVGVRAVLDLLLTHGPMTVPAMGRDQALSRQFVQRMVNDALRLGWVVTTPNPAHRRSVLVELTDQGRRTIAAVVEREHRALGAVGGGTITDQDVDTCLRVLRGMLAGLDRVE